MQGAVVRAFDLSTWEWDAELVKNKESLRSGFRVKESMEAGHASSTHHLGFPFLENS